MKSSQQDARLRMSIEELCDILERLQGLHEEMLSTLIEKEVALTEVRMSELEDLRVREEELLRQVIEEEKERLLVTEEVGDLLDYEEPSRIRVSEMLPYLPEDLTIRLSDRREHLREVALDLARQNSVNRALIEHSIGHVQVFMSKLASQSAGGPQYDQRGTSADEGHGSFFMDRRV